MTPEQSTSMNRRMGAMEQQLKAVLASLQHINDNMATKDDLAVVQADVAETKEIVATWKSVKLAAKFSKWLGGFVITVGAAISIARGWWHS